MAKPTMNSTGIGSVLRSKTRVVNPAPIDRQTDNSKNAEKRQSNNNDERTLFREVVANRQDHGVIVMEHVGGRLAVQPGTFLGRVVAVARSRAQLEEDIRQGIRQLKESIRNSIQTSNPKEADK